jgi:hypothetical protein
MLYFLVLDARAFHEELRPALAASWRQRSFEPCRSLCAKTLPAAKEFADRYHLGDADPLLVRLGEGMTFDRHLWQHLAGELLWFSAAEIPELQTNINALACLLAPAMESEINMQRTESPPIIQAHHGSRDLIFGGGFYRPDNAGWNDHEDCERLAAYLTGVRPEAWRAEELAALPDLPAEEREEELAFLRDWFPALKELYVQAAKRQHVVVCETLE